MIRIALAIPTTASWAPGRAESLARLEADLGLMPELRLKGANPGPVKVIHGDETEHEFDLFIHDNRSPREVWWERIASWAAETDATHFVQMQDDMRAAPGGLFWRALYAMIEARPDEILCLQSVHQAAPALAAEGVMGYTTTEGLLGPAYVFPMEVLKEALVWRKKKLRDGALQKVTEDTLLGIFAMATRRKIWSPVPTIVDHPGETPSTYGNDVGKGRENLYATRQRPIVRWDNWHHGYPTLWDGKTLEHSPTGLTVDSLLETPVGWREPATHLGRFYPMNIPRLARAVVVDYSEEDQRRDERDTGVSNLRRLHFARRAKEPDTIARLFVCTPVKEALSQDYVRSVLSLMNEVGRIEVVNEMTTFTDPGGLFFESNDLVRVRSRFTRMAKESDCTHQLLVDADMRFPSVVVDNMLKCGYDFVQVPYPRRDGKGYSVRLTKKTIEQKGVLPEDIDKDTIEILGCGLGLTLLSRRCIEKMIAHYGAEPEPPELEELLRGGGSRREMLKAAYEIGRKHPPLVFDDFPKWGSGESMPTVALFQLIIGQDEVLPHTILSGEDTSFCARWRALTNESTGKPEQVRMYVGEGAPIDHWGHHLFEGKIEQMGIGLYHGPKST